MVSQFFIACAANFTLIPLFLQSKDKKPETTVELLATLPVYLSSVLLKLNFLEKFRLFIVSYFFCQSRSYAMKLPS